MTQKDLLSTFGNRIRKIRLSKDITQIELANICQFEKSTMSKIKAGQINVSYFTMFRISEGLDIHIGRLTAD